MPEHDYKKTGLLRAGFQYQDLIAIEILINFYRQRNLYAWVQLEAEDQKFRSVEDVVACRPDGLYELTQVKFTANPDAPANNLNWKWLTANGGTRKKSLLQKWATTTLHHKAAGTLAQAALKTDRVPDAEFVKCLKGTKVDYTLLSAKDKAIVEKQLGSPEDAKSFFESFEFIHSLPILDDFEGALRLRIAYDTDSGGWFQFRAQVQRWSTRKGQPTPDGKIHYIHLRQAFSVERSKPLPQGFLVPPAYSVPNEDFDRKFLKEITGSEGLTVLWGPPGRGKSTYLSHCVARIEQKNAVCIRHHYFLSLDDRSENRFHYHAIAQSLKHQLEKAIPDLKELNKEFGDLLETTALRLQGEGRLLIVVVDGLDHVWREHRDHEDMEMLFSALLPLPPNIRLVVGTQKIAVEHLPARLLNVLPTEHWTELPLMSQTAVHRWVNFQDDAGRLNVQVVGQQTHDQIVRAVANAFQEISQGLPLHLIYSFEAIARTGNAVTAEDVAALPACPTGDIRDYYRSFWKRMGAKARTILHVLSGLEFGPPPFAIHDCFGRTDDSFLALDEIYHLLDYRETEVRPFHGRLFAFVRDLPEHDDAFLAHAADVLTWIEKDAPAYWHWAWLWITKAQLGDPSDLLAGPNREWAINSLVAGFPIEQLITILDHAEKAAFDAFDLTSLLTFRLLKTRTVSGPEFQTNEWPLFQEIAISLSKDPHIRALLRATLHRASVDLLPFIVRCADESVRTITAQATIAELNQRIVRLQHNDMENWSEYNKLAHAIVAVLANDESQSVQRVLKYAKQFEEEEAEALIAAYVKESLLASNFDNIFEVGKQWSRHDIDHNVLAALCFEGLAPATKPELKALAHPAIRCFALLKGGTAKKSRTQKDLSHFFQEAKDPDPVFGHNIRRTVYEVFFSALATGLSGGKAQGWSNIPADAQKTWLSEAVRALEQLAGDIAAEWKTSRRWPPLQDIYGTFELQLSTSRSYDAQNHFIAIRLALRDIAIDLCTIAKGLDSNALIGVSDINSASMSPFWLDELWVDHFTERRISLHTPEAARALVERVGNCFDTKITEFNERTTDAVKLAMFASDYDLVPLAQKELKRALGCLLGYGWRKDLFALEVLESLDLLTKNGDGDALKALLDLAGEFEALTDYTDGAETNHIRGKYYKTISTYFPERIPACYAHLIRAGEWHYAEALATTVAETNQVESRTGRALLDSYIIPSEISAMEEPDLAARPHTEVALVAVRRKTGRIGEIMSDQEETMAAGASNSISKASESAEDEVSVPNPNEFPPERLEEYLSATSNVDYDDRRKLVTEWLRYWEAAGRADEVLIELEAITSETKYYSNIGNALDVAFEIALQTQGRSKAFLWLIRAQVTRSGWQRWIASSDDEAQARMQMVAQHYRERWREFIKNTSIPIFATEIERNGIVIGSSRLVYFLVEMEVARTCALAMARIFKKELAEQPIEAPEWSR